MEHCKFFLQSRCVKGTLCAFKHERPAAAEQQTLGERSQAICKYYVLGRCNRNSGCSFRHSTDSTTAVRHVQDMQAKQQVHDTRSKVICKYHSKGFCGKGSECPFLHRTGEADGLRDYGSHDTENDHDTFQRTLQGAFVQFADGASILTLSLASDFSSVQLQNLPAGSDPDSISRMARELQLSVPLDAVRMLPILDGDTLMAQVTIEDPGFAKAFCGRLNSIESGPSVQAVKIPPRLPYWASTRRISCKKVIVSWHKPTRLIWLNFGQESIAKRVAAKFNSGYYKILGQTVRADEPTESRTHRRHLAFTVLLHNAPSSTCKEVIRESIKADYDYPHHIELDENVGTCNIDDSFAMVENLLKQVGAVEFTNASNNQAKRFKAIAIFGDENDARTAVDLLHDKSQHFLNNGRLFLQLMSSSKFVVNAEVHRAVENQLAAHIPNWQEQHLNFRIYTDSSSPNRFVTLKIEGVAVKQVANAADVLDDILAGRTIEDSGCPFWNPALMANGAAFQTLKQIEHEHSVLIIRTTQKRQLRYFGPDFKYFQVRDAIFDRLSPDKRLDHLFLLSEEQFFWICRGGFNLISSKLGASTISLDVVSTPKKLIITGSEEQFQQAVSIINRKQSNLVGSGDTDNNKDCPICLTLAEDPVTLSCGHTYCLDCFERLCTSAGLSNSDYAILCQGDIGRCKRTLALPELRAHLSSRALEDVFEHSFATYVRRRPQELKYCPTPDCGYIYRANSDTRLHTCTKCLELVCTACDQQHGTMSCAEYKDIVSGGYEAFEQFKKAMKIKDCPKCKTPIEKTYGCNHMTCGGCGTHLCWVCLKIFGTARLCNDHLASVHGGIFPDMEDMLVND